MSYYYVYTIDMNFKEVLSIGSPYLLSLMIVVTVSVSGRMYQDHLDTQKAEAATLKSSAVACETLPERFIP